MRVKRVRDLPEAGVSRPEGPIDFRNADLLRAAAAEGLRHGVRILIVDLSEVRYVNSLGISALLAVADLLDAQGGALLLANATPKVKVVYDLMGLSAALPLHRTVAAAVAAAGRRSLSKNRA